MKVRSVATAIAAAAFVAPLAAWSQPEYVEPPYPEATLGSSVDLTVNVNALRYSGVSNDVDYGVGYGAIIGLNPVRNFGFEINYAGGVNDVSTSADGRLVTNQIGGDLRVNFVPLGFDLPLGLRPFVFGGAAYHRVDTQNFTPGISSANGVAIPAGGGLDLGLAGMIVGARFTYNWVFNELDNFSGERDNYWTLGVNLGTRFGG